MTKFFYNSSIFFYLNKEFFNVSSRTALFQKSECFVLLTFQAIKFNSWDFMCSCSFTHISVDYILMHITWLITLFHNFLDGSVSTIMGYLIKWNLTRRILMKHWNVLVWFYHSSRDTRKHRCPKAKLNL